MYPMNSMYPINSFITSLIYFICSIKVMVLNLSILTVVHPYYDASWATIDQSDKSLPRPHRKPLLNNKCHFSKENSAYYTKPAKSVGIGFLPT